MNLQKEVEQLKRLVTEQAKTIAELKARLDRYENPKNSRNSSIPPSQDYNRPQRTKSLRKSSGKKPGGQTGHEGYTLQMTTTPDEVIEHTSNFCNFCGCDVSMLPTEFIERRQEVEIPVVKPIIVEHKIYQRICTCGNKIISDFPTGVTPGISYGKNIENLIAYMSVRQFLPYKRMQEFFNYVFNIPISQGTIFDIINRVSAKALPAYNLIRQHAETSVVSGGDETGTKINGKKGWFWTIQGPFFTFIMASLNRGKKTLDEYFPNGFVFSVLVHDCWKTYFNIPVLAHQICFAHLLRELNHIIEIYKLKWAEDFNQLLSDTIEYKKTLSEQDYQKVLHQRDVFETRLDELLEEPIDKNKPIAITFQKRIIKYRQHVFTFLYHHGVPPDNNASERAIRNVKIKHKVSGFFKSYKGAQSFAILRSVIDTAIKNNINPLYSISQINSL